MLSGICVPLPTACRLLRIADRQGRSFKRLNELFAATGQVGFLASQRVDGKLILAEAVKVLVQKAASAG